MDYEVIIGIPVYKAIDYIGNTMDSVFNHTFGIIGYLIVDDCEEDDTIDIVEHFHKERLRGKRLQYKCIQDFTYGVLLPFSS